MSDNRAKRLAAERWFKQKTVERGQMQSALEEQERILQARIEFARAQRLANNKDDRD
jgi:hypothetical protein